MGIEKCFVNFIKGKKNFFVKKSDRIGDESIGW